MKRRVILLLALLLAGSLTGIPALADEPEIRIAVSGSEVLPGQPVILYMTVPEDGTCDIDVVDGKGEPVARVAEAQHGVEVDSLPGGEHR